MNTSRWMGGSVVCMAIGLAYSSFSDAQQPARQPTRRIGNQNPPGAGGVVGGAQQAPINRQPTRSVQGGPANEQPVLDQQSGRFRIDRRVIRPGLRRLPPRPNARWRLGIQVDNAPMGLRISEVVRNSPAFRFGLERGDYLLDVMGFPVGFHRGAYFPLAETLNQTVRRDGWVNILIWNRRTNAEEALWIRAEPRQSGPSFRSSGSSSENSRSQQLKLCGMALAAASGTRTTTLVGPMAHVKEGLMKCDECGREVPEESVFCPMCGAQLVGDSDAADHSGETTTARRFKDASKRDVGKQPPEEELWSGTYSAKAMVGPAAALAVLTILAFVGGSFAGPVGLTAAAIGAVVLWAIWGFVLFYRRMTVHYRLTTFRLFHESGLLSRKRDRIEVIDINDVTLSQGIIERMFNTGTVHIESSDTSDPEFDMLGIDDVRHVADLIDNTRRAERQRRGLFMENI